jgi:DNA-directed RNA polymerase specialized sigma24 family protein
VPKAADLAQVRLAAAGNVDAFAGLYERGFRCAWAFSTRHCAGRDAAEALTEAILTRAFATLARFSEAASWPAWLGGIAAELWAETCAAPAAAAGRARS